MLKYIAQFLSAIFHPLLMPLFGLFLLFNSGIFMFYIPIEVKHSIYVTIFLSTIVLPIILVPFLRFFRLINNIFMEERRERIFPLMLVSILYFFTYYWFKHFAFSTAIQSFMLSITIISLMLFAISFFWKISMHMAGIGGLTGLIFLISFHLNTNFIIPVIIVLFISGILGTARLILGSHTASQVYYGYFLGLVMVLIFTRF